MACTSPDLIDHLQSREYSTNVWKYMDCQKEKPREGCSRAGSSATSHTSHYRIRLTIHVVVALPSRSPHYHSSCSSRRCPFPHSRPLSYCPYVVALIPLHCAWSEFPGASIQRPLCSTLGEEVPSSSFPSRSSLFGWAVLSGRCGIRCPRCRVTAAFAVVRVCVRYAGFCCHIHCARRHSLRRRHAAFVVVGYAGVVPLPSFVTFFPRHRRLCWGRAAVIVILHAVDVLPTPC